MKVSSNLETAAGKNGLDNVQWDLSDKYLRLKKKSIKKLISLPPKYMGNLTKGIEEAIFKSNQEIFNECVQILKLITFFWN